MYGKGFCSILLIFIISVFLQMKFTRLLLMVCLTGISFKMVAQNTSLLRGTVRDATTNAPIAYAAVSFSGSGLSTVTNSEGSFRFAVPAEHATDSIVVASLGYKTYRVGLKRNLFATALLVAMVPQPFKLREVAVVGHTPRSLLAQAIRASTQLLLSPVMVSGYYREFTQTNGQYTKFADALVDYYLKANPNNVRKPDIQVRVRESRAGEAPLTSKISLSRAIPSPISVDRAMAWYNPIEGNNFLDSLNFDSYIYTIEAPSDPTSTMYYVISFRPATHKSDRLNQGTVRIDRQTLAILTIDSSLPADMLPYSLELDIPGLHAKVAGRQIHREFYQLHGQYYPGFARLHVDVDYTGAKGNFRLAFTSEILATDAESPAVPFTRGEQYSGSLYKNGTYYQHPYWQDHSILPATKAEEAVIAQLAE